MKVTDVLSPDLMIMNLKARTKTEAIKEMADREVECGVVTDEASFIDEVWAREKEASTGVGHGIAIPHAQSSATSKARVLFAKSQGGVDYDAIDGQPVHLFFMITAPKNADNVHLQALAALSRLLMKQELVEKLKKAQTPAEVMKLFAQAEGILDEQQAKEEEKPVVVGVTACINGIAHTYMAQQALLDAGKKLGVDMIVETNGSEGTRHRLTASQIAAARGVIVAADKKVAMDRFDKKQLISVPVVEGIAHPDKLIAMILHDDGEIFHAEEKEAEEPSTKQTIRQGFWRTAYRHLMNGLAHVLPFALGGGLLVSLSRLLPVPVSLLLARAGRMALLLMIPVLAGYIAESIGDKPALFPGFLGGLLSQNLFAVRIFNSIPGGVLGGILSGFCAGGLVLLLKKAFKKIPDTLEGIKPMLIYPLFVGLAEALIVFFVINPAFSAVNFGLEHVLVWIQAHCLLLVTALLAALMAVDWGGLCNKLTYMAAVLVFANSPQTNLAGILLAAVMAGGMIPPLATALATLLFPKSFDEKERQVGRRNWLQGISFITEGALPFTAVKQPLLYAGVIGAALAGLLVGLWHTAVPAPHGGLWLLPLTQHPWFYLSAVGIGTVLASLLFVFFRKKDAQQNS